MAATSAAAKHQDDPQEVAVLFGSQTGNAQDVAEDLKRQICRSARYGRLRVRSCTCQALDDFDVTALPLRTIAIFVTSTTGQGDPPDNMRKFWRFLCRKSLPLKSSLPDLNYAVFGLGDSSYPKYNVVARKLYKRLEDLGAEPMVPLLPLSLGDERAPKGGHFAALDRWVDALLASMARVTGAEGDGRPPPEAEDEAERCPLRASVVPAPAPGSRAVAFDLEAEARRCFEALGGAAWRSSSYMTFGKLASNEPMAAAREGEEPRDVRRVEIDLGEGAAWSPGDALAVVPSQRQDRVDAFLDRIGRRSDEWVVLGDGGDGGEVGQPDPSRAVHLGTLIRYCLDATSAPPRSYFFQVASRFVGGGGENEDLEREKLRELGQRAGRDDLWEYCTRERRSVLECLQDFPSVQLPLEWALALCPRLQPRQFSISSAQDDRGDRGACELTVAVVNYKTPWKREIEGLCSTHLRDLEAGSGEADKVPAWVERGSLRLGILSGALLGTGDGRRIGQESCAVLVGPGTGIAPFKSLADHLTRLESRGQIARDARILVFFGCRAEEGDFLHQEFWEKCAEESDLFRRPGGFVAAFSRQNRGLRLAKGSGAAVLEGRPAGALGLPQYSTLNKYYVQDAIEACREDVHEIVHLRGGAVYVAGSAGQMPKDVRAAIAAAIGGRQGLSESEAEAYMRNLESSRRYQVEAWA